MKKYYCYLDDKQVGPFTIEELKNKDLSKDTLIWFEGLDNWISAKEVDELKEIFNSLPPPLNSSTPPRIKSTSKRKSKKWIIFIIIGLISIAVVLLLLNNNLSSNSNNSHSRSNTNKNYNHKEDEKPREKTKQELRQELSDKEKRSPKDHLSVKYKLNYRVLSGKDEITGKVYNSASVTTFKDVVLNVKFSTETGKLLSSENYVIYKYVKSGSSIPFNIKTVSPRGTKKIGVYIQNADSE